MIQLGLYALREGVELPVYGTSMSTCFDLSFNPGEASVKGYDEWNNPINQYINDFGEFMIRPGDRMLVPTGVVMQISKHPTIESYSDIHDSKLNTPLHPSTRPLHPHSLLQNSCTPPQPPTRPLHL